MYKYLKKTVLTPLLVATFALTAIPQSAMAQDKDKTKNADPAPDLTAETVLANVAGKDFTWRDIVQQAQITGIPYEQIHPRELVNIMATRILVAQENPNLVEKSKAAMAQLEAYKAALTFELFVSEQRKKLVTEKAIQAKYKEIIANFKAEQIQASHILVKTEDEAKAIIAELAKGANFAELAKTKSTGPSGKDGGALGWFGKGQMVPEFENAAFALKKGKFSQTPVKTQFGFHVIKLNDKRMQPKPTLAELKEKISEQILQAKLNELLAKKAESSKIKLLNQDTLPK